MDLSILCNKIENMSKMHQIGVLKILNKNCKHLINENKNGIYVNLSEIDHESLTQIKQYILYVNDQETSLFEMEEKQNIYKNQLNASCI